MNISNPTGIGNRLSHFQFQAISHYSTQISKLTAADIFKRSPIYVLTSPLVIVWKPCFNVIIKLGLKFLITNKDNGSYNLVAYQICKQISLNWKKNVSCFPSRFFIFLFSIKCLNLNLALHFKCSVSVDILSVFYLKMIFIIDSTRNYLYEKLSI